jgi:hypothetical protein
VFAHTPCTGKSTETPRSSSNRNRKARRDTNAFAQRKTE